MLRWTLDRETACVAAAVITAILDTSVRRFSNILQPGASSVDVPRGTLLSTSVSLWAKATVSAVPSA